MTDETAGAPASDRRALVAVAGDLDVATVEVLSDRVVQALLDDIDTLVIDLSGVEFLDSSGIGALVSARNKARERGAVIVLRAPAPRVARILQITGMDRVFDIEPT